MAHIQTVTGDIPPKELGFCQCHEHLMITKGASYLINKALCIDDYEKSLREITDYAKSGGLAIVDAQPAGCCRDASSLLNLSRESGVHIISSTGFHKMIFYPAEHWIFQYGIRELAELFTRELTEKLYICCDTKAPSETITAKAGIIKCALDTCGLNRQYKKLFDSAIMAHQNTGAPVMVHIEQGSDPLSLSRYLMNKNVDLSRVIFCHMDRACPDLEIHKELCLLGIYLEYDTIGRFKYHSDQKEADIFAELCEAGYEDQILFSLDTTRERLKSYNPDGAGLTYILNTFIPLLKTYGITDAQIKKFSCTNCRKILCMPD